MTQGSKTVSREGESKRVLAGPCQGLEQSTTAFLSCLLFLSIWEGIRGFLAVPSRHSGTWTALVSCWTPGRTSTALSLWPLRGSDTSLHWFAGDCFDFAPIVARRP